LCSFKDPHELKSGVIINREFRAFCNNYNVFESSFSQEFQDFILMLLHPVPDRRTPTIQHAAAGGHVAERTQNRCLDCAGKELQCSSCAAAEQDQQKCPPVARLFQKFQRLFGPVCADEERSSIIENMTASPTQAVLLQVRSGCDIEL
jgi:hypothetical protein